MDTPSSQADSRMTLLAFTEAISRHINSHLPLKNQWVVAEIADFRMHGIHAYGQLIEKDASGQTVAKINANIWHNNLQQINRKFQSATGQCIVTGMKLLLKLTATHSPAFGLSANISDIDPSYTLGDMERLRREILDRLRREGIYDMNRSLPLSPNPQRLAVISAEGAAGYGDFMNQLSCSGFAFYPLLYPASMQGERTVASVMAQLDRIEMAPDFWDCVIIIRGGGATSDLNSFDNFELARRVATFPIPVIVGIGHERDNTVLDYIAHTRCKTPTAVATFLIERLTQAEGYVENLTRRIMERTRFMISGENQKLAHLAAMVPVLAPARLQDERHRLTRISTIISRAAGTGVRRANARLGELAAQLAQGSAAVISRQRSRLDAVPETLQRLATQKIRMESQRLEATGKLVEVLSPAATLKRGYSITRIDGKAIRSASDAPPGSRIETILADGSLESIIIDSDSIVP